MSRIYGLRTSGPDLSTAYELRGIQPDKFPEGLFLRSDLRTRDVEGKDLAGEEKRLVQRTA